MFSAFLMVDMVVPLSAVGAPESITALILALAAEGTSLAPAMDERASSVRWSYFAFFLDKLANPLCFPFVYGQTALFYYQRDSHFINA